MKRARSVHKKRTHAVGVRELRANLKTYVERARNGDEVVITERGVPVARIVPQAPGPAIIDEMIAAGLIEPATVRKQPLREEDLLNPIPGFSLSDYLVELRGERIP